MMASTALVWFRRDLRVHDHPPLRAALDAFDRVVPVFVLDDRLLDGRFESPTRAAFLFECLKDLRTALQERGGNLVVVRGKPERELPKLAREHGATATYFASDVSPFAMRRDKRVETALQEARASSRAARPATSSPTSARSSPTSSSRRSGARTAELPRREIHGAPRKVRVPSDLTVGEIPSGSRARRAARAARPRGAQADARLRPHDLRRHPRPPRPRDQPPVRRTCTSAASARASSRTASAAPTPASSRGATSTPTSSCTTRATPTTPTRRQLDGIEWDGEDEHFDAWREGRTGFRVVDAGMRQLARTGWMHNRARLITACFLVKDLHIDWRRGEQHFMHHLLDGDVAQNNGNWQWISSVGVDPAPLHRRLYNPALQEQRHDPDGVYVDTWAPDSRDDRADRRPRDRTRRTLQAYGRARGT